ncbi:sensor domain-containing diguanylate cyclase [Aliidiomarina haloalkalitolerans]|uniref:diguanylate cyclase n=1 Tax=Aliidiomarina haloalkalitolerans TaxID=859059 RepID=A0A432VQ81_9GAMM|nr:sensor domain-containing diguanylate cyclase [Aliidiomarina haloalkalitolerans]RUO18349.1 hypothetical protein CWE06_10850 [Aliidiomarina haloalkalitolerans]
MAKKNVGPQPSDFAEAELDLERSADSDIDIDQLRALKQQLRTSHDRLENLIKSIPAILYSVDLPTMELEIYSDIEDTLGYAESKFSNLQSWYEDVLHPEDKSTVLNDYANWMRAGAEGTLSRAYRLRNRCGQYMWVRDRTRAGNKDERGRVDRLFGSITDISRTMTAHERLEKIAATVPGAIYHYHIDTNGVASFPYTSAGIESIYGLKPEEVRENGELIIQAIHPDDRERVRASISESQALNEEWFCEYRVNFDGQCKWVTGYAIPERHDDGSISWYGQVIDTTTEKELQNELELQKRSLEKAQQIGQLGYWRANVETGELYWSDMIYQIFGITKGEFNCTIDAFRSFVHPDDLPEVIRCEEAAPQTGAFDVEHRIVLPSGEIRWVHELADYTVLASSPVLIGTVRDITEQKNYQAQLERMSMTDSLTGIYNRRFFVEQLESSFSDWQRRKNACCLAIFDIDYFKQVNDTYGHAAGDSVLVRLSERVKKRIRKADIFARLGGEEFGLILPHTELQQAQTLLEEIRNLVATQAFTFNQESFQVTISVGVTEIGSQDSDYDELLIRADGLLYEAKNAGRNRVIPGY